MICGGFSQGLVLLCRALGRRGVTRIAVEDPCFAFHRQLIQVAGLEPVPVPVDDQGMQTSRLAGLEVGAVLLSPAHSYPSGVVLSADRRVQLLEWARTADALVIEDDYDAELRYDRLPVGALQGLDPERVIYGGSVSKVLSPALRLGWIVAPPQLIDDIICAKFFEDFAAEALGQLTLARFIDGGALARHLRRVRPSTGHAATACSPLSLAPARYGRVAKPPASTSSCGCPPASTRPRSRRRPRGMASNWTQAARHWADRHAAPPALLIGYGTLRESALARGIEALGADLRKATRPAGRA